MSTPTPRTDAAQFIQHDMTEAVSAEFARTLERELAADRARLDWLLQDNVMRFDTSYHDRAAIDAAMKEEIK